MRRLRLLTAWELLAARAEAERCCRDEAELGLWQNACLLARAVTRWGRRPFAAGAAVLRRWSPAQIAAATAQYQAMLARLREMPEARIQWRVLRAFGALPSERRARRMTRGDYLYCVLHLLLDEEDRLARLCPDCRSRAEAEHCPVCGRQWEQSAGFDPARYETLKAMRREAAT